MKRPRIRAQVATGFGSAPGGVVTDLNQRKMLTDTRSRQAMRKTYKPKRKRK